MAEAAWEATVAKLREGTRLYLTNDFSAAETLFKEGMGVEAPAAPVAIGDDENEEDNDAAEEENDSLEARDVRGAFALQYAIVGLMKGVASLANDQLDECLARLWEADRLAALDTPWVGKKVVRGVCTLCAGIVQCLQQNLVRGVYNILRSWQWIRYLRSEALEYQGVGKSVVRSAAQLALGVFAMILSLLPPTMVRAASWSTGFEIDREAGIAMLKACQEENGIYAPIAALALLSMELDTKTFLGESQSADDLKYAEGLLAWGAERFEDSVFFSLLRAELHACRHELESARGVVASISDLPCVHELKALNAVVAYKRAVYHLAQMQWHDAGKAFEESLSVYKAAGRRSMSPAMAMCAVLSHLVAGEAAEAAAMIQVVQEYKSLDKSNWARQDRGAFRLLAQYLEHDSDGARRTWALLELAQLMTIAMRCTWWMNDEQCAAFVALVEAETLTSADQTAQRCMILGQVYTHRGKPSEGLAKCIEGLGYKDTLGTPAKEWGLAPMLHMLSALLHAKLGEPHKAEMALQAAASDGGKAKFLMQQHVTFKSTRLRRELGLMVQEAYQKLSIPAGRRALVSARLEGEAGATAEWDWAPEARDLDFAVTFKADGTSNALTLAPMARHDATGGPVEGRFELPSGCKGGELVLEFSNYFSYLRSKQITYRLSLPDGAGSPTVAIS